MNNKKVISVIAVVLAALMVMSLMVSIIPVSAYAVTEDEVAAIQAQKKEISGRVKDCKERLDALKQQQANVLEQRAALMDALTELSKPERKLTFKLNDYLKTWGGFETNGGRVRLRVSPPQ